MPIETGARRLLFLRYSEFGVRTSAEEHGDSFHGGGFGRGGFGDRGFRGDRFRLAGFKEAFIPATTAAITLPLRIRALLSDRLWDDLLLLIAAQTPRANLRIVMLH
jgi:hypothetical protein